MRSPSNCQHGSEPSSLVRQPQVAHRYPRAGTYLVSVQLVRPAYLDPIVGTHDVAEAWASAPVAVG